MTNPDHATPVPPASDAPPATWLEVAEAVFPTARPMTPEERAAFDASVARLPGRVLAPLDTSGPASDAPAPPRDPSENVVKTMFFVPTPRAARPAQEAPSPHPVRPHTPGWGVSALERMQARAEWAEQSAHTRGERLNELRSALGWLESVLRPGADPVEVYLAGLRQPGQPATAFQVEVAPASGEGRFSVNAPTLQGALTAAASRSPAQEATPSFDPSCEDCCDPVTWCASHNGPLAAQEATPPRCDHDDPWALLRDCRLLLRAALACGLLDVDSGARLVSHIDAALACGESGVVGGGGSHGAAGEPEEPCCGGQGRDGDVPGTPRAATTPLSSASPTTSAPREDCNCFDPECGYPHGANRVGHLAPEATGAPESDRRMLLVWEAWAKHEGNDGAAALFRRVADRLPPPAISELGALDDDSLAFYDTIAPRCYIADVDKTPDERRRDVALAAMGFVPLLKEVHRLRATVAALTAERGARAQGQQQNAGGKTSKSAPLAPNQQQEPEPKGDSTMPDATLTVPATWTDDCQGKKDFDGHLVTLSTRYWPRGGSMLVFQGATFVSDGSDPERQRTIPPSAHATIYLGSTANEFYDDAVKLVDAEFSGETEAEVKRLVEEWAAGQYARIGAALRREYGA